MSDYILVLATIGHGFTLVTTLTKIKDFITPLNNFVYDSEGNLIEDRSKSLKSPMIGSMDYFGARYLDPMLGLWTSERRTF